MNQTTTRYLYDLSKDQEVQSFISNLVQVIENLNGLQDYLSFYIKTWAKTIDDDKGMALLIYLFT